MEHVDIKVRNSRQAVVAAVAYLRERDSQNAPPADAAWQEKTLYAAGGPEDYAVTGKLFTSSDWLIEVTQNVAPLSATVYQVTVFSSNSRRLWKGSIKANGAVTDTLSFKELPVAEAQTIADDFTRKTRVPPPRLGGYGH